MAVVKDKATAFKNEISGAQTNKIICKASSHEVAGPKKKHVDYLLQLTSDPKCQFTILADLIADRLKHTSWVVVFKGLILSHNLMTIGNEKFLQCVATRRHMFDMDSFSDKSDLLSSDMSSYLRKYARYVRHIGIGYKALAVDVGRLPKGDESPFGTMDSTKLLKSTAVVQDQLDLLLEVEFVSSELSNGVINTVFLMLYKDLIKLYSVYNDAMINLLEKFFEMKRSDCKEVIGFYRRFLLRQETVQRFLQLAEGVGVDKESHLNLRQVPENFLPALEQHLSEMESAKKSGSQPSPQIQKASAKLQELREKEMQQNKPPSQTGSGIVSGFPSANEEVLEAQRKRFEELKRRAKEKGSDSGSSANSSSVAKPTSAASTAAATTVMLSPPQQTSTSSSGAGDLLSLDTNSSSVGQQGAQTSFDPWGSSTPSTSIPAAQQVTPSTSNPFSSPNSSSFSSPPTSTPNVSTTDPWGSQAPVQSSYQEVDLFKELRGGPNFDSVFGQSSSPQNSFPAPASTAPPPSANSSGGLLPAAMGDMLTPQAVGIQAEIAAQEKKMDQQPLGLTTDVESSLARAAANLSIDTSTNTRTAFNKKASHQWTAPKESVKTGGPNFQKQNLQNKTITPMESKTAANWGSGMQSGHLPVQPQQQPMMGGPQMMGRPQMMGGPSMGAPMMMGTGMMPQYSGMGMGQPMMGQQMMGQQMMGQPFMQQQQPSMGMQGSMGAWPQPQQQNPNPFGQQQQNPSLL